MTTQRLNATSMFAEFAYITIKRKFVPSFKFKKNIILVSNAITIHSK